MFHYLVNRSYSLPRNNVVVDDRLSDTDFSGEELHLKSAGRFFRDSCCYNLYFLYSSIKSSTVNSFINK